MPKGSKRDNKEKSTVFDKLLTIIGTVLCLILAPVLIINITLIVKSYTNKDEVPKFGGFCPLIVLTDSMYPTIKSGDLIIVKQIDGADVQNGDIISFFDPESSGTAVVTHRVIAINDDGTFTTQGDANNTEDKEPVPQANLVGIYKTRIEGAGNIAMFMQTTTGLVVCVIVPIILLVIYDMLRRKAFEKKNNADTEALLKELEELKKQKESKNNE